MKKIILVLSLGSLLVLSQAKAQTISTVAGGGASSGLPPYDSSEIGDGGAATSAFLNGPFGICVLSERVGGVLATTIFIADTDSHRIRKVAADGTISTVVGIGEPGFLGDGGPALEAKLNNPSACAVQKESIGGVLQTVLYIADTNNDRVRRAVVGGNITTLAGDGSPPGESLGDGSLATEARLARPSSIIIVKVPRVVVASRSRVPSFITKFYIADTSNGKIRRVQNGIITTVAGGSFIIPPDSPYGDGGPATEAYLELPFSVAAKVVSGRSEPTLYISDTNHYRIRKVTPDGDISTYVGGGVMESEAVSDSGISATDIHIQLSHAVTVGRRALYVSDAGGQRVYKVVENADGSGTLTNFAGNGERDYDMSLGFGPNGDGGNALDALLNPHGLAMDKWGSLFIADTPRGLIRKVAP